MRKKWFKSFAIAAAGAIVLAGQYPLGAEGEAKILKDEEEVSVETFSESGSEAAARDEDMTQGDVAVRNESVVRSGVSVQTGEEVRSFSLGPGYQTLPYADPYGDYQWALLNTGIFKLVPNHKAKLEDLFQGWLDGGSIDAEQPGPSEEGEETTVAAKGIDINILPAWKQYDAKPEKRQVTVALIDTGVDYSHEDLADSIWVNGGEIPGDGIDNDGNGFVDDVYGWNFYSDNNQVFAGTEDNHGTHSAGTIAAARNDKGIVGINDPAYVKIMIVKTLATEEGIGKASNVAKAIRYAEANGASICNLSFGTSRYSEELYETIKNSKMLFVVAAGNADSQEGGYDIDRTPVYPASFDLDNIIAVANLQFDGKLDPDSNYGASSVDLAAPGNYILSTVTGNQYKYMSGTSMAAPMVTGAAALLYSYDPQMPITELKGKLLNSAKKMNSLTGKVSTGGMLNVAAALSLVN